MAAMNVIDEAGSRCPSQYATYDTASEPRGLGLERHSSASDLCLRRGPFTLKEGCSLAAIAFEYGVLLSLRASADLVGAVRTLPLGFRETGVNPRLDLCGFHDERFGACVRSTRTFPSLLQCFLHWGEQHHSQELPKDDEANELDDECYVRGKLDHEITIEIASGNADVLKDQLCGGQ